MERLKSITAIIIGGALGFFIYNQFISGNIPFAVLGIGIIAIYFNLLLNITTLSPRTIIERTTEYMERTIPTQVIPRTLYKRKPGVIIFAEIKISKITDNPCLQLTITTKPFVFPEGGRYEENKVGRVFKAIPLMPGSLPYENLKSITGLDEVTEESIKTLIGLPIKFELEVVEYEKVARLKVARLYKGTRPKEAK